jgi:hypothetical protein
MLGMMKQMIRAVHIRLKSSPKEPGVSKKLRIGLAITDKTNAISAGANVKPIRNESFPAIPVLLAAP